MLSKQIYKIRQTENVNQVAEKVGQNIVGGWVRLMSSSILGTLNLADNTEVIRAYLVNNKGQYPIGPILGLTWEDLEDA